MATTTCSSEVQSCSGLACVALMAVSKVTELHVHPGGQVHTCEPPRARQALSLRPLQCAALTG